MKERHELTDSELSERRSQIVDWLTGEAGDRLRTDHKTGEGFSVFEKSRVRTREGSMSITEFLKSNGFANGMTVNDYRWCIRNRRAGFPRVLRSFTTHRR